MTKEFLLSEKISNKSKENQLLNLIITYEREQAEWIPKMDPELFFDNGNSGLFQMIRTMFLEKKTISRNNLKFHINQNAPSSEIDFYQQLLVTVVSEVPEDTPENLIIELNNLYKSRRVYKSIFLDANRMFMENQNIEQVIDEISKTLFSLESNIKEAKIEDLAVSTVDDIFNPKENNDGLEIGLHEFDETFGGVKPDTYITIGAESGAGKTAVVVDLITRLCERHKDKIAICFFSMEMSQQRIMKRMLSRKAKINGLRFDKNRVAGITPEEKDRLYQAASEIRTWPLKIIYETMDIHRLKIKARQFVLQNPGKRHIFFVDHIGKIESSGSDMRVNTIKNSQGLKSLCIDHNATVFSLSQLLKELSSPKYRPTYHRPDESFIMESGAIKADSDIMLMLWRPGSRFEKIAYGSNEEWDCRNKMIWLNEKNRDGIEKTDLVFECKIGMNLIENPLDPF
jgi:replicative DNA helicase